MRSRLVMICLLGVWLAAPIVIGNTNRLPHEHLFIGQVTKVQLDEHLANEAEDEAARARDGEPRFESGFIVSVPFGNLNAWLALYLIIACVSGIALLVPHLIEQMVLPRVHARSIYLPRLDPPPRLSP